MNRSVIGRIHSKESFGAVDGPGLRYVIFMQGCPLRCIYCHNPDSRGSDGGKEITSGELFDDIMRYQTFICNGGVTISGGEPLLQAEFCAALFEGLKEAGIHCAIDTSGAIPLEKCQLAVDYADLLLLDIKDFDNDECIKLTGHGNKEALHLLNYCEDTETDVWIRQVLLEEYTLNFERLERLAEYLRKFRCIRRIELLPFHKFGEYKWAELGLDYKLGSVNPPKEDDVERAREIFRSRGFFVQ